MNAHTVVTAFSEEHVERLTGITKRQLRYWDSTGFFRPTLAHEDRRQQHSRIYSFRDVACLQVLSALRNEANCSLQHLREVKEILAHMGEDLWAKTTLYVHNRKVVIINSETQQPEEVVSKQAILQIPLAAVSRRLEAAVGDLMQRDPATIGKVQKRRGLARSRPVVAGTRIRVASIQAFAKEGYSVADIQREYPSLTEEDVRAALRHGAVA